MHRLVIYFLLPIINALTIVKIHRNAFYHPNSSCAFIRNASLSNNPSSQSCIWECVYEHDCQTAVYFHDENICSMFTELCSTGSIESAGTVQASVICNRKNHGEFSFYWRSNFVHLEPLVTCSSTSTSVFDVTTARMESSTELTSSKLTTPTERPIVIITRLGDSIVGVYNTTAGASTGGKNGMYSHITEFPEQAIDNSTDTKYLNFGSTGGYNTVAPAPGVGTGFYVTPNSSNASIAIGLRFATGRDAPNRDPITVTLEGSNANALDVGSSWTLIYNGSTGISPTTNPGRSTYVPRQNFSNIIAYKSYRLIVTSQRGPEWAVQYSEVQIIGYV